MNTMSLFAAVLPYPIAPGVMLCGAIMGYLCMDWYRRLSPQARIEQLSAQAATARHALAAFDGDDAQIMFALCRQAIAPSLERVRLVCLPAVTATLPAIGLAWLLEHLVGFSELHFGPASTPAWLVSGHVAFWVTLAMTALAMKQLLGIK